MTHDELVAAFGELLGQAWRLCPDLAQGHVTVSLPDGVLTSPLVVIPDVHLADAGAGDVFFNGDPNNVARLEVILTATQSLLTTTPSAVAVQVGDWFDVWRASGGDVDDADFGAIQNAQAYEKLLELDADIGLPHVIGNHDASFLSAIPDARATQPAMFRLGAWIMPSVYAMHGHQTDLAPPPNSTMDQFVVAAATILARFIPGPARLLEDFIDAELDVGTALKDALLAALGKLREDPAPSQRPKDTRPGSPDATAVFVQRENADVLAKLATKVASISNQSAPKLLVVGHSHNPCVAWSSAGGTPMVIVDAGSCVYSRCNVLLGAGNRVTVFDVVATQQE